MERWQQAYILFMYRHLQMHLSMPFDEFVNQFPVTAFDDISAVTFKAGYEAGHVNGYSTAKREKA